MALVKVPGIPVMFSGGEVLVVPPLSLGVMEQIQERIAKFSGGATPEDISTVLDAAHAALQRNYPEITRQRVGELLDLGNMLDVFQAVMDVSGLLRKAKEATDQGEAQAPLIGGASTPA